MPQPLPEALIAELTAILGERFTQNPVICAQHGHDESHFPDAPPQGVAFLALRPGCRGITTDVCVPIARLAEALNEAIVATALRLEGTCTGEHGIGLGKRHFLRREMGEGAMSVMRAIKAALDPHHLFNPGKIVDENSRELFSPNRL